MRFTYRARFRIQCKSEVQCTILAAFATTGVLSLGSLVGLLTILGIATRNGIMMISHFQHLEEEGMPFRPELVLRGARERIAPIMMTALTTGLALAGNIPGHEIEHPMASSFWVVWSVRQYSTCS